MKNTGKRRLYIFGWPSNVGGADTKLTHLLLLLHNDCEITVIPNENRHLHSKTWNRFLDKLGVRYGLLHQLPDHLDGVGLSMSNECFFTHRIAHRAKEKGLAIVWSSEMMWHHEGELEAIKGGLVSKVLYTSEFQKVALEKNYRGLPWAITGNYIDPDYFPFTPRRHVVFTVGRLSRPAPEKYPEDFPVFYECLQLPEVRFRVMAWDDRLRHKYRWHKFDARWDLLKAEQETQADFLHSLDLFIYPLGHTFRESWGRSTVEAMLTGAIPLVPTGHHLENLLRHGETGFVCFDIDEYKEHARRLFFDSILRAQMSAECRKHAVQNLCDREQHRRIWIEALFGVTANPVAAPEGSDPAVVAPGGCA